MTVLNRLGYCFFCKSLCGERIAAANKEMKKRSTEKVTSHLLLKFEWDNIEAKLVSNVLRLLGKSLDWYEIILVSEQMPRARPIATAQQFRKISPRIYPTAESVASEAAEHSHTVNFFKIVNDALVAVYQRNIVATERKAQVSMEYLYRMSLQGSCSMKPASISSILLSDMPSNCASTAAYNIDELISLTYLQKA